VRTGGKGGGVDLVLKGRGVRITDQIRRAVEHKLVKIGRLDPRVVRVEIEIIGDLNPRVGGRHRVEVACTTGRRTLRAEGLGGDVDSALDQATERLERQVTSYRKRLQSRMSARADRLQSRRTSPEGARPSE
jgi:ribosomal subunit interface protein